MIHDFYYKSTEKDLSIILLEFSINTKASWYYIFIQIISHTNYY